MNTSPIDHQLMLAHTMVTAPGTQAVLLGSGVSRAANVPTGWEVTLELIRRIAAMNDEASLPNPEEWFAARYERSPDYPFLLSSLARTPAERRSLLQSFFVPTSEERAEGAKLPTAAHRSIAKLASEGVIRVILTTNFDRLMETALRDEGLEPVVISTPDAVEGAAPLVHQQCVIVKLHGDYLDNRLLNTEDELATYDPRMDAYLDRVLDEFGLIICGWSAIYDTALRAAIERCKARRYTTTWVQFGAMSEQAEKLVRLRDAKVVAGQDANQFFEKLAHHVESLVSLNSPSPLTAPAALAALKRYIDDPAARTRLEDLIIGEARRVDNPIAGPANFMQPPNPAFYAARVRRIEETTTVLRPLFFHGCRLSNERQQWVFLSVLSRLSRQDARSGYVSVIALERYPASLLLHSGALGALLAQNWRLLRELLYLPVWASGNAHIACERLHVSSVLDTPSALYPQNARAPTLASTHMAEVLNPLATDMSADPEALFDELESWIALAYLDATLSEGVLPWMPPGRFIWRGGINSQPEALLKTAEAEGHDWAPLKAGWFGGRLDRWESVRDVFKTLYAHMSGAIW